MVVFSLHSMSPSDVQGLQSKLDFITVKYFCDFLQSKSVSCQLIAVVINIIK